MRVVFASLELLNIRISVVVSVYPEHQHTAGLRSKLELPFLSCVYVRLLFYLNVLNKVEFFSVRSRNMAPAFI